MLIYLNQFVAIQFSTDYRYSVLTVVHHTLINCFQHNPIIKTSQSL